jgi:hypothetical protein
MLYDAETGLYMTLFTAFWLLVVFGSGVSMMVVYFDTYMNSSISTQYIMASC